MLIQACPALNSLLFEGALSPAFLQVLGQACPLLSELEILTNAKSLHKTGPLLSSLLPQLTSLMLPKVDGEEDLPDMSQHKGIVALEMRFCPFVSSAGWLRLPPNLKHLECHSILQGPAGDEIGRLLSLHMLVSDISLMALAQLMRAAPAMQALRTTMLLDDNTLSNNDSVSVSCSLTCPTTAVDLALLETRTGSFLENAIISISGARLERGASLLPFIAALPHMPRVKRCGVNTVKAADLGPLLRHLPEIKQLWLGSIGGMDDVVVQDVAACQQLRDICLKECHGVSSIGLVALCHHLPKLRRVVCEKCSQLGAVVVKKCAMVLRKCGINVVV